MGGGAGGEFGVEPVERPVEPVKLGPAEVAACGCMVGAMGQQEVARRLGLLTEDEPSVLDLDEHRKARGKDKPATTE